jgi:hypothetical protein
MAMRDRRMNKMMIQHFPGTALCYDMRESFILEQSKPAMLDEPEVQALVTNLHDSSLIKKTDLDATLFNRILSSGTKLKLDDSSPLSGLGGCHGSHIQRGGKTVTLYYSANVHSEVPANGSENGIAVFNKPWKNVVATLYHESTSSAPMRMSTIQFKTTSAILLAGPRGADMKLATNPSSTPAISAT